MSAIAGRIERFDDGLNPVVVKELRQAASGRFLTALLMVFLLAELALLTPFVGEGGARQMSNMAGRSAFLWMMSIVAVAVLVLVPAYAGLRLMSERWDGRIELLMIVPLGPGAILWGKVKAAWLVSVLIITASMPFLMLCYLLRGIDLPSILAVCVFDLLCSGVAITFAVCLGAYGKGPIAMTVTRIIGCCGLLLGTLVVLGFNTALSINMVAVLSSGAFWSGFVILLTLGFPILAAMIGAAIDCLNPPRWPRSAPHRPIGPPPATATAPDAGSGQDTDRPSRTLAGESTA